MSTDQFFAELPAFRGFAEVVEPDRYHDVPTDWLVAITDVRGSTDAIRAGRYKDVNALGASSIVAVLNAAQGLPLPYVFGGDGATLLFPASRRPAIEVALRGMRALAQERMGFELRVGIVPVGELVSAGHPVRVARFQASDNVSLAMLAGSGLSEAERLVKDPDVGARYAVGEGVSQADLEGFECRWEPLKSRNGHMVSLLVQARGDDAETRTVVYRQLLGAIEEVLGDDRQVNPAHSGNLEISGDPARMEQEARLRGGASGLPFQLHRAKAWVLAQVGRVLIATGQRIPGFDGATYRDEVVVNTDYRKFDEMLRMVIDLTAEQLDGLETLLSGERAAGRIAYGIHTSSSALMTCLIFDHEGDHVHFVDGSDGGYAMAAVPLKKQLKAASDSTPTPASQGQDPQA